MIEVQANLGTRPLGKRGDDRTDTSQGHKGFVTLGVLDDDGIASLLCNLDGGANGLEARGVDGRDSHVLLLRDLANVT